MNQREAFEKWAIKHNYPCLSHNADGSYNDAATDAAWDGWQAAMACNQQAEGIAWWKERMRTSLEVIYRAIGRTDPASDANSDIRMAERLYVGNSA